jgi:hypothetical protein
MEIAPKPPRAGTGRAVTSSTLFAGPMLCGGLVLAAVGSLWALVVAATTGGRPWPFIALLAGTVGAVLLADRLGQTSRRAVLWVLLAAPLLIAVVHQRSLLGAGPLGYSNASGALFLVAATAGLVLAFSPGSSLSRQMAATLAVVWLMAPWLLAARTAALGGLALMVSVMFLPRLQLRRVVAVGGVLALLVGLLFLGLGLVYEPGPRSGPVDRVVDASLGELRVVLWSEAVDIVAESPVTGVGLGGFQESSPTALVREDARWAHNEFLQTAAETGVPGAVVVLASALWLLLYVRAGAGDARSILVTVTLVAVVINANLDYIWHFAEVPLGLGLLIGATIGLEPLDRPPRRSWMEPSTAVVLATVGLGLALLLPSEQLNPRGGPPNAATLHAETASLVFDAPGLGRTSAAPEALYQRLSETEELSIEVWLATGDLSQDGPARIVSSSEDIINRNLTLGQSEGDLAFRLRTTATDWNAVDAAVRVPGVFETTELQHVVVTTDLTTTEVFVDGEARWRGPGPGGRLDSWNHTFPLLLGNEAGGERPWLGELRGVAVHDQMLDPGQIAATYVRGPPRRSDAARAEPSLVASYVFDAAVGERTLVDRSPRPLAGDLLLPATLPGPRASLLASLTSVGEVSAVRLAAQVLLFAIWAGVVTVWLRRRSVSTLAVWIATPAAGVVLAVAVALLRHQGGRVLTGLDLPAALLGSLIGVAIATIVLALRGRALRGREAG